METPRKQLFGDHDVILKSFRIIVSCHKKNVSKRTRVNRVHEMKCLRVASHSLNDYFHRSLSSSKIEVLEENVFAMTPNLDLL